MKDFLIIITGGTIDAMPYTATPVHIVPLMLSIVPRTVKQLGLDEHCHYLHWSMKDSKQFDDYELRTLAKVIAWSEANYVVITHGTCIAPVGTGERYHRS
jgi:L-asparaginase/Glu-tRNA(Gln) amidotransferase subunit D